MKTIYCVICAFILFLIPSCVGTNLGGYVSSLGKRTVVYQKKQPLTNDSVYQLDGKYYLKIRTGIEAAPAPVLIYSDGPIDGWKHIYPSRTRMEQKKETREKKYLEEGSLNHIVFLPLVEEAKCASATLSTGPEFSPSGNGREYGLDYDKHIPLEEFDIKRATPCGMSGGLNSFGGCYLSKDTIEIELVSDQYPEKTWLYYVLTPLRWAAYAADIPCSAILTAGAYVGGVIHCIIGYDKTDR